jgi:DNA-binding NtrC family response regulator
VIADGPICDLTGTCVIADAVRLTRVQQDALRSRLEREPALRLVTLSPVPLFPLVESGQFDETLYYRLNTITIDRTSESTAA